MLWHKFDRENHNALQDHYYYLVTHKDYATPMKAKWHEGCDEHWEIFVGMGRPNEIVYTWDKDCKVIAWMEMPEIYATHDSNALSEFVERFNKDRGEAMKDEIAQLKEELKCCINEPPKYTFETAFLKDYKED